MKCVNHPDRDAVAQCNKCMKLLCDECRILSKDGTKAICRPCLAILKKPPEAEQTAAVKQENTKFCKHCGNLIPEDAVICTKCGRQVEQLSGQNSSPNIVVNNSSNSSSSASSSAENVVVSESGVHRGRPKSKAVSLLLCFFLGVFGAHKFYEGHIGMGVLYILTLGFFCIGVICDFIYLLFVPDIYYVY